MIKRWHLALAFATLLFAWGCSGCKKRNGGAASSGLYQYVPKDNYGILTLHKLADVPQRLNALLLRYEGAKGQFRTFIKASKQRIGIDPLVTKDLTASGMDPSGSMLMTRFKANKRNHGLMVVSLSSASAFEKWLKDNLTNRLVAKSFVPTQVGDAKVVTAYRVHGKKSMELIAYTLKKKAALITWSFQPPSGDKSADNAAALKQLLAQKAQASAVTDKQFQQALTNAGRSAQAVFYMPPSKEKVDPKMAKARAAMMKHRLNQLKRRFPLLSRVPDGQLQALTRNNPFAGVVSSLSFGQQGISLRGMVPIPKMVMAPVRSAIPTKGSAKALLKALHKDAMVIIKGGVEPAMLPIFFQQAAAGMKQDPNKLLGLLKKFTGLDVKKDIIPAATGHVMAVLYKLNMKPLPRAIKGDISAVLQMLELALVAEAKDPKLMNTTLKTLAAKFNNGPYRVKTTKEKDGRASYSVTAWPGVTARWTSYKGYFIYGLTNGAIQRTIDAINNPKARAYPDAGKAGIMAANDSSALSLDLSNIRSLLGELPFMYRLVVSQAIANYNLDKIKALTLSYQPAKAHAVLQAELKLK